MSTAPIAPTQLPSAATLARFFELSMDLVCVVNADGAITQINPAFRHMLGWARADLVGRPLLEFVHPDDVAAVRDALAALIQSQSKGAFECRLLAKDAGYKPIQWQLQADSAGAVYAIGREINPLPTHTNGHTKELKPSDSGVRRRTELQLRARVAELEARSATVEPAPHEEPQLQDDLRLLFSALTDLILVYNADGRYLQVVPTDPSLLYKPPAEMLNKTMHELMPTAKADELLGHIRQALAERRPIRAEYSLLIADQDLWFEATVAPRTADTVFWVAREITERKRAEEAQREGEARLRLVVDTALDALVAMNSTGVITSWNPQAETVFGWSQSEAIGRRMSEVIIPERFRAAHENGLKHYLATGEGPVLNRRIEITGLRRDGSEFPVELTVSPIRIGDKTYFTAFLRDISRRKQDQEALEGRNRELAAINRIVAVAASSTDLRLVLSAAARELQQLLNLSACGIGMLDAVRHSLLIIADANADPAEPSAEGTVIPIAGNLSAEHVLQTKQALVIDNAQTDPLTAPIHALMRRRRTTGLMIVPLLRRGEVIGTVGCDIIDPDRRFTVEEVAQVENIAGQLAGAIENLRLLEEAQRRASEMQTVAQVSSAAATLRTPQEMLQTVVDLTKQNFGLYHAHVYLLNEVKDTLVLTAGAGEVGSTMVAQGWRISANREQSLVARAARTRRPVVINDVQADTGWLPNPLLPNTRAEMALPLSVGSDVLGVLDVQADAINRFDDGDIKIMSTLAAQIATALQNARLFQRTEHAVGELNTLTQRLTREGWQQFLTSQHLEQHAYTYDLTQVREVQAAQTSLNGGDAGAEAGARAGALRHPLKVQGQTIGQLAVAETFMPEADAEEIMAAVADRLSQHLENLRLADETRLNLVKQERLSAQLAMVAQVSTVASTILERQQLLNEVVNLAQQRFGLYHANVYLFDDVGQTLNLHAASGAVGQQMVEEGRSIPLLLEYSIVARAARDRQAVVVNDVLESQSFMPHPLLPNTRAELAVPMLVGERLLGIFDLQADTAGRFADDDVRIQATLAAQVAVALQNAISYAEQTATVTRLRELDQLKSSFLANMSHELRTPLNSILGFTDVILEGLDGPLTGQMDNDLKVVQKNGQHLLKLINDILDMAKIEAGRMTISPEPVDLTEVVEEVVETTAPLAREKKLLLNTDMEVVSGLIVEADRMRLRQVLLNLIGNSIKFTDKGSVTITAENLGEHVLLCVKDTGIGIPPEQLESIFEAFSQIDATTTRKAGGTGLGLPISRHLIELHGGRLWAESPGHSGEGARFFVELPIRIQKHLTPPTGFISEGYSG